MAAATAFPIETHTPPVDSYSLRSTISRVSSPTPPTTCAKDVTPRHPAPATRSRLGEPPLYPSGHAPGHRTARSPGQSVPDVAVLAGRAAGRVRRRRPAQLRADHRLRHLPDLRPERPAAPGPLHALDRPGDPRQLDDPSPRSVRRRSTDGRSDGRTPNASRFPRLPPDRRVEQMARRAGVHDGVGGRTGSDGGHPPGRPSRRTSRDRGGDGDGHHLGIGGAARRPG